MTCRACPHESHRGICGLPVAGISVVDVADCPCKGARIDWILWLCLIVLVAAALYFATLLFPHTAGMP
jgi:hypothetical protein